jgi:hypothetical protein
MAREFRDDQGRPWLVSINVEAAKRVKASVKVAGEGGKEVPFDMLDTATINQTITVLRSQFIVVGEVLCALLEKQLTDRGITHDQFLEGLRGDALDEARKVVEEEWIDFFPKPLRVMVGLMARKMSEVQQTMMDHAKGQLENVTVEALIEQSGAQSTKLPGSSESTPQTGHIENSVLQETPS